MLHHLLFYWTSLASPSSVFNFANVYGRFLMKNFYYWYNFKFGHFWNLIFLWEDTAGHLQCLAKPFFSRNLALNLIYPSSKWPWSLGQMSRELEDGEASRYNGEALFSAFPPLQHRCIYNSMSPDSVSWCSQWWTGSSSSSCPSSGSAPTITSGRLP